MRKQTRAPKPAVLVEHGERWTQQWVELRQTNPAAQFSWYKLEGRPANDWLLPDLRAMNQRHCCFCDAFPVEGVSNETIEHFRPKSRPDFVHLAYEWENLFYCCDDCQKHKREQWDDGLLRPDTPDFEFERFFVFDYTTGNIQPSPVASEADRARAEVTIKLYGLCSDARRTNRKAESHKWQQCKPGDGQLDDWAYRDFLEGDGLSKLKSSS